MYGSSKYAFPGTETIPGVASRTEHHPGMTLREHYAGLAMQAMIAASTVPVDSEVLAKSSLHYADALIKALEDR